MFCFVFFFGNFPDFPESKIRTFLEKVGQVLLFFSVANKVGGGALGPHLGPHLGGRIWPRPPLPLRTKKKTLFSALVWITITMQIKVPGV